MSMKDVKFDILKNLLGELAINSEGNLADEHNTSFLNDLINNRPEELSSRLRSLIFTYSFSSKHPTENLDFEALQSRKFNTEELRTYAFIGSLPLQKVKDILPEVYEVTLDAIQGVGIYMHNIDIPPIREETLRAFKTVDEAATYINTKHRNIGDPSTI